MHSTSAEQPSIGTPTPDQSDARTRLQEDSGRWSAMPAPSSGAPRRRGRTRAPTSPCPGTPGPGRRGSARTARRRATQKPPNMSTAAAGAASRPAPASWPHTPGIPQDTHHQHSSASSCPRTLTESTDTKSLALPVHRAPRVTNLWSPSTPSRGTPILAHGRSADRQGTSQPAGPGTRHSSCVAMTSAAARAVTLRP